MKQRFKNKYYSRTEVKNNILSIWHQCEKEDKYDWYKEAQEFSLSLGVGISKGCGIIAAFSPLKNWDENKRIATLFCSGQRYGLHTGLLVEKAESILVAETEDEIVEILNGYKIVSFYLNMRYPERNNVVTIDRHAISIAINDRGLEDEIRGTGLTKRQYQFFEQCYIWTANQLNVRPNMLQSATWLKWRELKGITSATNDEDMTVPF